MTSLRALNISHLVIAAADVPRMTHFFESVFCISPHYSNEEFSDFVLPGGARVAFFKPTGKSAKYFSSDGERHTASFGITVTDADEFYRHCLTLADKFALAFSGPPKEHPWGEPSFLLVDTEGNRWEVTQSPTAEGLLVNRDDID